MKKKKREREREIVAKTNDELLKQAHTMLFLLLLVLVVGRWSLDVQKKSIQKCKASTTSNTGTKDIQFNLSLTIGIKMQKRFQVFC